MDDTDEMRAVKTLFLGSYGFGNLGDELCLIEAMQAFPSTDAWVYSANPDVTTGSVPSIAGFITDRGQIRALAPERVVLGGGGVGFFPSIRDMLHWMDDAFRIGAKCHIHNIGVAWMEDRSWAESVQVQRVLGGLASCTVRDHISAFCMRSWPANLSPTITYYPERLLPADDALVGLLPRDVPKLGISITGQAAMRHALRENVAKVMAKLTPYRDHAIIPIISTVSATDPEEDDIAGFEVFRGLFLKGFNVGCEEFLDKAWWRANMTPLRLKGLIGGLDAIFTQRKHNLIHAIGAGTRAIGIYPAADDSIARIFYSLRDKMPPDSSQLALVT
jgi:hypothetical protein